MHLPPLLPLTLNDLVSLDPSSSLRDYGALKGRLKVSTLALVDELIRVAMFHATGDRFAAIKRCWTLLDSGLQHISSLVDAISRHDRTSRGSRRADFVGYIFVYHLLEVTLLWGCDHLLDGLGGVAAETLAALQATSVVKVSDALVHLARHASALMVGFWDHKC